MPFPFPEWRIGQPLSPCRIEGNGPVPACRGRITPIFHRHHSVVTKSIALNRLIVTDYNELDRSFNCVCFLSPFLFSSRYKDQIAQFFHQLFHRHSSDQPTTHSMTDYSEDQVAHVTRIKHCKDFYEVLQVNKEANDADLKKSYRKLALVLHPDKNSAPGASEAFKAVGNAFAVLSDKEKRRQYDLYGSDEVANGSTSQGPGRRQAYFDGGDGYYYDYSRGFEGKGGQKFHTIAFMLFIFLSLVHTGNVSAEELFNMFFGGGFPTGNVYVRRPRQRHSRQYASQEESPAHSILLQAMPLLILIGVSLFSQFMVSDPPFSLQRTRWVTNHCPWLANWNKKFFLVKIYFSFFFVFSVNTSTNEWRCDLKFRTMLRKVS